MFSRSDGKGTAVYQLLPNSEASSDVDQDEKHERSLSTFSYARVVLPWVLTTVLSLCLCSYLAVRLLEGRPAAFPTDFKAAHKAVEYEQRSFSRELTYNPESGRVERSPVNVPEPDYFASPFTSNVDDEWMHVMRGEYTTMTSEEARPFLPELQPWPTDGQYHLELDMFHSLHCLNAIRMHIHKDYYETHTRRHHTNLTQATGQKDFEQIHLAHCMDQLRQTILCHGDLSPIPMYYWKGFPITIGRGGEHTCRKWQPIRDWLDERNRQEKHSTKIV